MIEQKLVRCDPADPNRCQATVTNGQCPFLSAPGQTYCAMHSGKSNDTINGNGAKIRNFRLGQWQSRVEEFADNSQVKSLREEIGILRIMLEEIVTRCKDGTDLMIYSSKISDIIMKIEKLVASCHRLELSTGLLLDKSTILQIAGSMVEILSRKIEDQEVLTELAEEIMGIIISTKVTQKEVQLLS